MSKDTIHYNTADNDDAPPPSYNEAQNSAYNPHYVAAGSCTFALSDSSSSVPSAPPLPHEQQQPPHSSPGQLYPSLPAQQQQQQQPHQHQYYQQQQQQQQPHYQNGGHYHYQTINIPPPLSTDSNSSLPYRQREMVIRHRSSYEPAERRFPIGALLFLFGCLCPFLWFVGACCCSGRRNPYEAWWGKANTVMALLFILSSIIYSMVAISFEDWMIGLRLLNFSTA